MKQLLNLGLITLSAVGLTACGAAKPAPEPEAAVEAAPEAAVDPYSETGNQRKLSPIKLDPFTVDSLHIGDVSLGHFNLYVKGGEPAVVRAWVGDEAATDVVVTKAEFEVDHHCAHLEVPQPLSDEAKLWVEVETADGQRLKGSTDL